MAVAPRKTENISTPPPRVTLSVPSSLSTHRSPSVTQLRHVLLSSHSLILVCTTKDCSPPRAELGSRSWFLPWFSFWLDNPAQSALIPLETNLQELGKEEPEAECHGGAGPQEHLGHLRSVVWLHGTQRSPSALVRQLKPQNGDQCISLVNQVAAHIFPTSPSFSPAVFGTRAPALLPLTNGCPTAIPWQEKAPHLL